MTYSNYQDLQGHNLNWHDTVKFKVGKVDYNYIVTDYNLRIHHSYMDDKIFTLLNLDKLKFCEYFYKHSPRNSIWPSTCIKDYESLTKVVLGLFLVLEGRLQNNNPDIISVELSNSILTFRL